jgi:hypothetical protein
MSIEQYCPPKQLPDKLSAIGAGCLCARACYRLVESMKSAGMPVIRGNSVRPSDAYAFLQANPNWRPFSKAAK